MHAIVTSRCPTLMTKFKLHDKAQQVVSQTHALANPRTSRRSRRPYQVFLLYFCTSASNALSFLLLYLCVFTVERGTTTPSEWYPCKQLCLSKIFRPLESPDTLPDTLKDSHSSTYVLYFAGGSSLCLMSYFGRSNSRARHHVECKFV